MYIPPVLGAPRHCYIGDEVYWVRQMTVLGLATLMNWLHDVLPGREERKGYPKIGDDASQRALQSFPGLCVLSSLAMAPHGFSFAQAATLVPRSPDDDGNELKIQQWIRLHDVFLSRRRTMTKGDGSGEDWSDTWLDDKVWEFVKEYGLTALGNLTLDQYDWLFSGGKADEGEQYDLRAVTDNFYANTLPMIKAAMAAGTIEDYQDEKPAVIKMAMERGIVEELPPFQTP